MSASAGPASAGVTSNDYRRAETSATSAQHLPETSLRDELEAARSYDFVRACALAALLPRLPETERQAVLRDALEVARKSREANDLVDASVKVLFLDIGRGGEQQAHERELPRLYGYRPHSGDSRWAHRPEHRLLDRPIVVLAVIPT